ncbi:proprotein convertase P-domain-containing protein [Acaryochloris sp. IP29b_bin.148]|uniref:proprotein convertase P-domain-containing protein n=1 Tax=Acaryochloris sp. IP29b_bin.148 TaxID=2969218 RepID=UPI002622CD82|nr:proprotein convertase P-domain-containing protein [Acaryochloris sp. IP29b_bin.148]
MLNSSNWRQPIFRLPRWVRSYGLTALFTGSLLGIPVAEAWAISSTNDDIPAVPLVIPEGNSSCNIALTRTFNVTQSFTVRDVTLGLNIDHTRRGEIAAFLTSPSGQRVQIINNSNDRDDNYDVLLVNNTSNNLDDGNADNTSAPFFDRDAPSFNGRLAAFYGTSSQGTWTLELCDRRSNRTGTYNRGQLILNDQAFFDDPAFPAVVPNPDYNGGCSANTDIAVVLDASGSINATEANLTRQAVRGMLDELATIGGPVQVGIVEFAETAEVQLGGGFTDVTVANITNVFQPYLTNTYKNQSATLGSLTNWEAAFQETVDELLTDADVVIFISDGNPNTISTGGGTSFIGEDDADALAQAMGPANAIKTAGKHIYAFGVTEGVNIGRLVGITDGTNSTVFTGGNGSTADYDNVSTFNTNDFRAELISLVQGLCATGGTNNPNVLLVKRITAINGNRTTNPNDSTVLNTVVDGGTANDGDNHPNWPSNYLVGETDAGRVKPGDEIEYTVYFLNAGTANADAVRICDRLQTNQAFKPEAYGVGADVQLQLGTSTIQTLTAANDAVDRTELITTGTVPATCNITGINTNGTLQVDITGAAGTGIPSLTTLPGSTGQGQPNNAYGFFRFTTTVDQ